MFRSFCHFLMHESSHFSQGCPSGLVPSSRFVAILLVTQCKTPFLLAALPGVGPVCFRPCHGFNPNSSQSMSCATCWSLRNAKKPRRKILARKEFPWFPCCLRCHWLFSGFRKLWFFEPWPKTTWVEALWALQLHSAGVARLSTSHMGGDKKFRGCSSLLSPSFQTVFCVYKKNMELLGYGIGAFSNPGHQWTIFWWLAGGNVWGDFRTFLWRG